jgi:hydrocephalus-inducing protein
LLEVPEVVEYPKKVDSENILHLLIIGPTKSGKTHIAQQISKMQKRALIKLDELISWVLSSGSETADKIKTFLADRRKEFELATQEREKAFKKAGKKAKELEEKLGPSNEALYEHLPEELWLEAIKQRVRHPECNAGCVFDNLNSKHLTDEAMAISLILKALGTEAVSLIDLYHTPKAETEEKEKKEGEEGAKINDKKTLKKLL